LLRHEKWKNEDFGLPDDWSGRAGLFKNWKKYFKTISIFTILGVLVSFICEKYDRASAVSKLVEDAPLSALIYFH